MRSCFITLITVVFAAVPARADSFDLVLPPSFVLTSATSTQQNAQTFTAAGAATTNILGYSLRANWTSTSGDPWSSDVRVSVTAPGQAATAFAFVGGVNNGGPFTFPGGNSSGGLFSNLTGPLPSTAAGNFVATLFSVNPDDIPSTATFTNAAVSVYHNPTTDAGDTTSGPTYNRLNLNGTLSTTATAVRYSFTRLTVSQSGVYMLAQNTPNHDGAFYLYQNAFDPSNPTANYVGGGDDDVGTNSVLVNQLNAGTDYFLVSTGFSNTAFGIFTTYGAGPGVVTFTPIPEPTFALVVAAAAAGWLRARRRRG